MRIPIFVDLNEETGEVRISYIDKGYFPIDGSTYNRPIGEVVARAIDSHCNNLKSHAENLRVLGDRSDKK